MSASRAIGVRKLLLERKSDGARRVVTLRVGRPYWIKKNVEAACDVEAKGLFSDRRAIHGVDTLQALELAAGFMTVLLKGLTRHYRIYWPDGYRYALAKKVGRRRSMRAARPAKQPRRRKSPS
jgi:hypothetical protein